MEGRLLHKGAWVPPSLRLGKGHFHVQHFVVMVQKVQKGYCVVCMIIRGQNSLLVINLILLILHRYWR